MSDVSTAIWVYGLGVLVGLLFGDAPAAPRIGLALLWPVGPLAFLVTLTVLAAASLIAFPVFAAIVAAAALAWWRGTF